jgi:hypothetical protein
MTDPFPARKACSVHEIVGRHLARLRSPEEATQIDAANSILSLMLHSLRGEHAPCTEENSHGEAE